MTEQQEIMEKIIKPKLKLFNELLEGLFESLIETFIDAHKEKE